MPKSYSYHQAKSGAQAGSWVACHAEKACRNNGVHIPTEKMKELQTLLKRTTGEHFPMRKVTEGMVDTFLGDESKIITEESEGVPEEQRYPIDNAIVKDGIKVYNSLLGTRMRDLEKAREAIVNKYPTLSDMETSKELLHKMVENRGVTLEEEDQVNFLSRNYAHFNLSRIISAETQEEYEEKAEAFKKATESDSGLCTIPKWDDEVADYYDDYYDAGYDDTESFQIRVWKTYETTPAEQQEAKKVVAKEELKEAYKIASSEHMPTWALATKPWFRNNYNVDRAIRAADQAKTRNTNLSKKLAKQIISVSKARTDINMYAAHMNETNNVIANATAELKKTQTPIVREALNTLISEKQNTVADYKARITRLEKANPVTKLAKLAEQLKEADAAAKNLPEEVKLAQTTQAVEWLTQRFPSTNVSVKRRAAAAWVKNHPEIIKDFLKLKD